MKKYEQNKQPDFTYNEEGAKQVSEQIMDAYNSGVIDQREYENSVGTDKETLS